MMKKLTSFLLAGVLLLACLTGCGNNNGKTTGTGTSATGTGYTTGTGMTGTNTGAGYTNNGWNTGYNNGRTGMGTTTGTGSYNNGYADSDYQHSGVTGANRMTADM